MEGDRKYRQRGYNDSDRPQTENGAFRRDERPRPPGPRPSIDVTGPRLPRMVQAVTASRCYNCSTQLVEGTDFKAQCPKCGTALHCCKQCAHFEPSTRFQCLKPIVVRVSSKDQANECELFNPRVTVARDVAHAAPVSPSSGNGMNSGMAEPRNATDARAAFDSLFRKSDPE
ncbi:MAG TPA: hypothetical protein VGJ09_00935 [Bryobacteraceae bacterium]|jgi:hypothetical protein